MHFKNDSTFYIYSTNFVKVNNNPFTKCHFGKIEESLWYEQNNMPKLSLLVDALGYTNSSDIDFSIENTKLVCEEILQSFFNSRFTDKFHVSSIEAVRKLDYSYKELIDLYHSYFYEVRNNIDHQPLYISCDDENFTLRIETTTIVTVEKYHDGDLTEFYRKTGYYFTVDLPNKYIYMISFAKYA